MADKKEIRLSVSALTFANTNYILLQSKKPEEAKQILRKLKLIVHVLPLDEKILELALNDTEFKDFEARQEPSAGGVKKLHLRGRNAVTDALKF